MSYTQATPICDHFWIKLTWFIIIFFRGSVTTIEVYIYRLLGPLSDIVGLQKWGSKGSVVGSLTSKNGNENQHRVGNTVQQADLCYEPGCSSLLWRALILVDWKICWKREVKDTTTEKSETHALWNDVRNVVDDYYIYYYELVPKSKKEKNWVVGAAVPQWSNLLLCWMLSDGCCCSTVLKLRWKEVGWICLPLTF